MRKFRFFIRFDKEEKWLEHMAEQGWLLSRKSLLYHFRKIAPGEKKVRIDYRQFKSVRDFKDYCTLFEDSGWQHIAGTPRSGTQYFLKINADSTEDIFSDAFSKAGRYKKLSEMWLSNAVVFMPFFIMMLNGELAALDILFTPKEWYYTPGLWELSGLRFWGAFLFETPFALMRELSGVVSIAAMLLFSIFAVKSWLMYRKAAEE